MKIILLILAIISMVLLMVLGFAIAKCQNEEIKRCLKLKRKSDAILTGRLDLSHISDRELLMLSRPKLTTVGMGGVGPAYFPPFNLVEIVMGELSRRRNLRI